jgi:hypothetical protein
MVGIDLDLGGLAPVEVPFKWAGADYVLREPSEGASTEYEDEMLRITKPDPETHKPTNMSGMMRLDTILVSRCVFKKTESGIVPLTPESFLDPTGPWTSRVVKKLRAKLKEISGAIGDEITIDEQIELLKKQKEIIAKEKASAKN